MGTKMFFFEIQNLTVETSTVFSRFRAGKDDPHAASFLIGVTTIRSTSAIPAVTTPENRTSDELAPLMGKLRESATTIRIHVFKNRELRNTEERRHSNIVERLRRRFPHGETNRPNTRRPKQ